jgi:hypothetical protein
MKRAAVRKIQQPNQDTRSPHLKVLSCDSGIARLPVRHRSDKHAGLVARQRGNPCARAVPDASHDDGESSRG